MIEICKKIIPYKCEKCGEEMLFFYTDNGMLIDYKTLFESGYNLYDISIGITTLQLYGIEPYYIKHILSNINHNNINVYISYTLYI